MAKTLKELFNKYLPTEEHNIILESGSVLRSRVDKEKRMIEVWAEFGKIIPKNKLYDLEESIKEAYKIQSCRILPKYPAELFDSDYIPEILLEAERVGVIARGFFGNYRYVLEDKTLTVTIPFTHHGISLLVDANTPKVIEGIIESEFGINI